MSFDLHLQQPPGVLFLKTPTRSIFLGDIESVTERMGYVPQGDWEGTSYLSITNKDDLQDLVYGYVLGGTKPREVRSKIVAATNQ